MNEDFKDKQIEQKQEYINKLENLIFQYGNECATIRDKEVWNKFFAELPCILKRREDDV